MAAEGMLCPIDRTPLVMSERQDRDRLLPGLRGGRLDRGKLDEIVERNAAAAAGTPPRESYRDRDGGRHYGHPKRCKSFLEELFD